MILDAEGMQADKGRQGVGYLGEGGSFGAVREGAETPGDHLAADVARLLGPAGGLREQHCIVAKEKRQKMCLEIIDQFEQLLEEKDISIPCEDSAEEKERHDGGNNARIYGAEYWRLEDGIHKILEQEDSDNTK